MLRCFAHCCCSGAAHESGVVFRWPTKKGVQTMRLHIEKHGHDPRQVDLVAVIALVVLVVGAIWYLSGSTTEEITTAFIVPGQTVHW
jgi:hypothetical protein